MGAPTARSHERSSATKKTEVLTRVKPRGYEEPGPDEGSCSIRVPYTLPSLTHNCWPGDTHVSSRFRLGSRPPRAFQKTGPGSLQV